MLCRDLGYRSPREMLADLTYEEWQGWLQCFCEDPWDEHRKDDRSAAATLAGLSPYMDGDFKAPGFRGPEYSAENDGNEAIDSAVARIEALKKRKLDGKLNRKTSDTANH